MKTCSAIAAILVLLLPGCGSTKPEEDLSDAQVITLLRELGDLGPWFTNGSRPVSCPIARGAWVEATTGEQIRGDTLLFTSQLTVVPDGCGLSAVGDTLVVEGDPEVVFDSEARLYHDTQVMDITVAGTITWKRNGDGEARACEIDMAMRDAVVDGEEGVVKDYMRGSVCGREMTIDYSELDWGSVCAGEAK